MDSTPKQDPVGAEDFVEPGLRPSPEEPSRRRVHAGFACFLVGCLGVVIGGIAPPLWWSALVGYTLAIAGIILLRAWRIGAEPRSDERDPRNLYGRSKA